MPELDYLQSVGTLRKEVDKNTLSRFLSPVWDFLPIPIEY